MFNAMAAEAAWERGRVQYLAQGHFGMQMGKTGIEPPALWLDDNQPQLPLRLQGHFSMRTRENWDQTANLLLRG
ncbi:unnamed protein product [Pleuronectes platessa]|uniref:Uncharacterized protein n=1 Tax=Pleuronectes platessa TaxID=8262 RepID=A0A9N7V680_PLEPL|nr:unnamed protein product [Pleuronectes platessa]